VQYVAGVGRDGNDRVVVLLLPERLEDFAWRPLAEDLLQAPGVVAVDPPRTSYDRLARIPDAFGVSIASKQARRLRRRLPGTPAAVAIFHPGQYPLARGLLVQVPDCELWYGRLGRPEASAAARDRERLQELHVLAAERASLTFADEDELGREEAAAGRQCVMIDPGRDHGPLWDRLYALTVTR
jgi:hypothetical protein